MGRTTKFDRLPEPLKTELLAQMLAGEPFQDVSLWLQHCHGVGMGKSTLGRLGITIRAHYAPLLALGMPPHEIALNRAVIDAMGVEAARQQLLAKLAERAGGLFGYLDEPKATE